MNSLTALVSGIACAVLVGCSGNPVDTHNPETSFVPQYSPFVTREASTAAENDLAEQALSNNRFAVEMYKNMVSDGENLFFSPYSITVALAMSAAGAEGETKSQIRDALQVTLQGDAFDNALNGIDQSLESHAESTEGVTLRIVNSTWMQSGREFNVGYLDHLSRYYGAGMNLLDFERDAEDSRVVINDWVADQTNDKILDLLPQGTITPMTMLVLTNAIYFLGDWLVSFDSGLTEEQSFVLLDKSTIDAPLMNFVEPGKKVKMRYCRKNQARALDLPYKGDRLVMTVLLPDMDNFAAFENSLTTDIISEMVEGLDSTELIVSLPKFKFTSSSISLVEPLKKLGMTDAFGAGADFSGISDIDLYISDIVHKAFIAVDEKGTEAAAATAVVFQRTSIDPNEAIFVVNRPFIFMIRDKVTGTILFMGRILDPTLSA